MSRSWPLTLALALALGCAPVPQPTEPAAATPSAEPTWEFFGESPEDLWASKIADWQARQHRDGPALTEPSDTRYLHPPREARLLQKSESFQLRERRGLAERVTAYSQAEARRHYRWDPETDLAGDPWPTSVGLYDQDGDDCDGLDLIAYDLLRGFGFPEKELYRVILRREADGANHMATLWFEEPDDPWVIDATGAITRWMRRLSKLDGWTPIRMFDEDEQWGVARAPRSAPPVAGSEPAPSARP